MGWEALRPSDRLRLAELRSGAVRRGAGGSPGPRGRRAGGLHVPGSRAPPPVITGTFLLAPFLQRLAEFAVGAPNYLIPYRASILINLE